MSKSENFEVVFDGEAVEDGTMAVRDFAPSMLALGDLFDSANEVGFDGQEIISLRVKADFEKASFHISLELVQGLYANIVTIFNTPEAQALSTLMGIVGVSGIGVIGFLLSERGRKPKRVFTVTESRTVRVEYEEGDSIEVPEKVWKLANNQKARRALEAFVKPLKTEGIRFLKIGKKKTNPTVIKQNQAEYFDAPKEKESEMVSEAEKMLRIVTLHFKDGLKWKFNDGGSSITAQIMDPDFAKKIKNGEIHFKSDDLLKAKVRTTQWQEKGELKAKHEIIQVLSHIKSSSQDSQEALL
jgi:hypothetical protein